MEEILIDELELVIKKMNNLFITVRNKYVIQKDDGSYTWLEYNKTNNVSKFTDYMLEYHLNRKMAYGIFSGPEITKFISFDVDMVSKELVLSLYSELNQVGISSKYIHTSWSGSKGYHVDIYFSKAIHLSNIKRLYDYIISQMQPNFPKIDIEKKIELRPSPKKGLKLPLGLNRKNSDPNSNVCWYVDVNNNFMPIKKLDYILQIDPINKEEIIKIINNLPALTIKKPMSPSRHRDNKSSQPNDNYGKLISNVTLKSLELLDENGLTQPGTRNASLCKLAIYYKSQGASKNQCKQKLIIWMNSQDKKYYKTPLDTCYKEIERIAEGVYKKNIHLKLGKTEIEISRNEILTLHFYDKFLRKTLNALFIHSKRYGDKNGEFIMTYDQLAKAAKYTVKSATTHIKSLEELKIIEVTRSPVYVDEDGPRNPPNKYKLNLDVELINDERNKTIRKTVKDPSEYGSVMVKATVELFPNQEWAIMGEILESVIIDKKRSFS
ncbi:TOTE conflict system archaeo-eukaryotic primase domain-containing protein [Virgibacillus salexigens]|uniref:TOTE conflict system primase domain-containing protein n=1 Tax=Virgibacillus kapii TaxID=1638645 RepID=A0ABQ2DF32_9BACI|nr:hypothetical protein [Virgibacillus kapii]GGJ55378.1 hypothetical protein GCM10007111_17070 [Virgibacillus kapii]